jgi:twitching motility protein PilT
MPQLDRYLSAMVSSRASAMLLAENDVATLQIDGAARPVTRQPLTAPQLLMLLREIAPADAQPALAAGGAAAFRYASSDGAFAVRVEQANGRLEARFTPDEATQSTNAVGDAVVVAAPVASVATPAPVVRSAERNQAARDKIDDLLRKLVVAGASDLHLRCGEPPIFRTHGEMARVEGEERIDNEILEAMLASIIPERNRKEYEETKDSDFAYEIEGIARYRANAMRERMGAAAVFRVIPATVVTVEQMGITPEVQNLCSLNKGLVLVTGPTGSGKSTTLCAMIDLVNRSRSDHVITIEDPIEFVHPSKRCIITQRQVGVHTSSFKSALRAALREDPDIILVGELRDLETVSIAIETAETGHLVFGTLHTTTAAGTVDRVIDQFPADRQEQIRTMLSESLKGVISQTLCKKIGGGRVAAREILLSIPAVSNLIREAKTFQIPSVMQTSKKLGMLTLNDALLDLVDGGLVESKEAYLKAVDKPNLVNALRTRGHDVSFVDGDPAAAKPEPSKPAATAAQGRPAMAAGRR